jgi:uncharacterized protein (TIGR00369 family)
VAPSEVPTAQFTPPAKAPVIVAAATGSGGGSGSPAMATLGGERVDTGSAGLVRVRFPVRREHLGLNGALSAGFLGAMLEVVVGLSAQAIEGGRQVATLEISTRFFRSIRTGHVVVDGTVLRAGSVTATIECVAWDDGGQLCAKATATNLFVG